MKRLQKEKNQVEKESEREIKTLCALTDSALVKMKLQALEKSCLDPEVVKTIKQTIVQVLAEEEDMMTFMVFFFGVSHYFFFRCD